VRGHGENQEQELVVPRASRESKDRAWALPRTPRQPPSLPSGASLPSLALSFLANTLTL
jgi:hypothetical protein